MEPSLPAVFSAGLLSFASPCVLPLAPIYLATLAGTSSAELAKDPPRGRLMLRASAFALGLSVPFVLLGLAASRVGRALAEHRDTAALVGAAVVVLLGLKQLRVLRVPWLDRDLRPGLERAPVERGLWGAILFGAAFGLGWTPCVGPVLGAVLTWTAHAQTSPLRGALVLAVYAAGISLPLVLAGAFAPTALRVFRRAAKHALWVERASGALLVLSGLWLVSQHRPIAPATATAAASAAPCAEASVGCGLPTVAGAPAVAARFERGLVEFVRRDCPACRATAPSVREAERRCESTVRRVVVDDPAGMSLARAARVVGVPTFVGYDHAGREVSRLVGAASTDTLVQALEDLQGRACGRPATQEETL